MSSLPSVAPAAPQYWEEDEELQPDERLALWHPRVIPGGLGETSSPAAPTPEPNKAELRAQFEVLADELAADAAVVSATRRLSRHPAYVGILDLGDEAIPFLLQRLKRPGGRPVWLTLLGALTSFQPGAGRETIEEAAGDWITWGKRQGRPT